MSTLRVTVEELTIHEHPHADALELAQVGLYRAVVAKGAYRTGDFAVYIPEQAVLPEELVAELGLTGKLAGSAANRVKAIRLRGELSQGIVCRPRALSGVDLVQAHRDGTDLAAELGIVKWVPPVPISMSGEVKPAPDLLPWIDIENLKRYPAVFPEGEPVAVTEKVHGTACCLTYRAEDDGVLVTSKGLGAQRLALTEDPGNLYWRAVRDHGVDRVAADIAGELGASRVGVYGEVYGDGVQDLGYGADSRRGAPAYAVFDIAVETGGRVRWLDPQELTAVLDGRLPVVPTLFSGPYDARRVIELAEGRETLSGRAVHVREGVVVRPLEDRYSAELGGRAIAKVVGGAYLTRKGGTEYE
ncbi:RNA ligase [Streptomyces albospinus]|uniref:RNA ligase n=1 Tax=Streptomyces albospinus TaxID=285515 RepID=A0ABQ2VP81_9ACTN|nr:RNA ligase (ATP) [Streptomyces albospinus]GGU98118.1 RNA ligase [Streptomyces albospinus]